MRKATEFTLITAFACVAFGIPAGLIGAAIAFATWELGARVIGR